MPQATAETAAYRFGTSSKINCGDLQPASTATCLPLDCTAYRRNYLHTGPEPVKAIFAIRGTRPTASPAAGPTVTTLNTPAGTPASVARRARISAELGLCSAGFSTTELPAANAGATFQLAMMVG